MPTKKQRAKKRAERPKGRGLTLAPKKKPAPNAKKETPNYDADVPDESA